MNKENQQIKLQVEKGTNEVIIRHGEAAREVPFRGSIDVSGTLEVPRVHLENHSKWLTKVELDLKEEKLPKEEIVRLESESDSPLAFSFIKVNREKGGIRFFEDVGMPWESSYEGALRLDPRFEKFGINSGKSYTTFELSDFIKMNRSHFETKDKAMMLVTQLRQFKAKVDKDVENSDDGRGNKKILLAQAVESNIPESFRINVPIFKGFEKVSIEVEISINASDFSCTLISPEVADYIEETKDRLIDA